MILVFDLASVLDFLYNVHWVIDSHPPPHPTPPPSKIPPSLFRQAPSLNLQTVKASPPFLVIPPIYWFFVKPSPSKNRIF